MAERWRRCGSCRKVRPIDDFTPEEADCESCRTRPSTTRATAKGPSAGSARASTPVRVSTVTTSPVRDLTGRGDPEVRARRARVRALDRLVEQHPEDFELLLAEERRAERL